VFAPRVDPSPVASAGSTPVDVVAPAAPTASLLRVGLEARPPPYAALLPRGERDPRWSVRRFGLTISSDDRELLFSNGVKIPVDPSAEIHVAILPDRRVAPRPLVWVHSATTPAGSPRHDAYALYSLTGKRLWFFEHDAAKYANAFAYVRVADLSGDGIFELTRARARQGSLTAESFHEDTPRRVMTNVIGLPVEPFLFAVNTKVFRPL
jgi:hypothetical protein